MSGVCCGFVDGGDELIKPLLCADHSLEGTSGGLCPTKGNAGKAWELLHQGTDWREMLIFFFNAEFTEASK